MKITPENPFTCPECGKKLTSKFAKKRHVCESADAHG